MGRGLRCRSSPAPKAPQRSQARGRLPGLSARPAPPPKQVSSPPLTSSFSCISRSAHAIRAASAAWRADRSAASCARSCSVVTRRPRGGGPGVAGGAHDRSSGGIVIGCTAHAANSSSSQARRISGAGSGWQRSSYGGFFRASPTNRQARECVHTIAGWKPDQPRSLADQKASQVMFHTLIPKRNTWISVG